MGKIHIAKLLVIGIVSLLLSVFSLRVGSTPPADITQRSWSGENQRGTASQSATLIRVVDGDTIEVSVDGVREKVRFMGIDAPESVDPRRGVECFGKESSAHLSSLLKASSLYLKRDSTSANRDTYNRLLRYVFTPEGESVNKIMIADGYAFEYTYEIPYESRDEFIRAEEDARVHARGLWSVSACSGKR